MNKRTFLSLLLCVCCLSFLHAERVDMQQAGADVQGRKLNTALINSTIDRLNAHGGGTLFFPAGTYLTGSIHMKSNITLELEAGATLKFSENFDDFLPYVEVRHEGIMMKSFQPGSRFMPWMQRTSPSRVKGHWTDRAKHGGRNFSASL